MLMRIMVSGIALIVLSATPVAAQTPASDRGFYGGLGIGRSDSDIAGATDSRDDAWKAFGGYQFNKYLSVEGGYVDLGAASTPAASFESEVWQASAVGSLPLSPKFAATGKFGLARSDTDITGRGSDDNTAPTYGLGLRYDFSRQFGIRGEWERFRLGGGALAGKHDADLYSVSGVVRFQ